MGIYYRNKKQQPPHNKSYYLCFKLFLLILFIQSNQHSHAKKYDNHLKIESTGFYEDHSRTQTLESIADQLFSVVEEPVLNLGYSTSAHWIKLCISNSSSEGIQQILSLKKGLVDSVQIYYYTSDSVLNTCIGGTNIHDSEKDIPGNLIYFPIEIPACQTTEYYIRVASSWSKDLKFELVSLRGYNKRELQSNLFIGFLIGSILIILLYNLFLGFSVRDSVYYHYSLSNLGVIITILGQLGLVSKILPESAIHLSPLFNAMASSLFCFTSANFTIRFLKLKNANTKLFTLLIATVVFEVGYLSLSSFSILSSHTLFNLLGYGHFLIAAFSLLAGVFVYRKGFKSARFYVMAWSVFFMGAIFKTLALQGLVPSTFFTSNGVFIAGVMETLLMSFALADRYKSIQNDKAQLELSLRNKENDLIKVVTDNKLKFNYQNETLERLQSIVKFDNSGLRTELQRMILDYKLKLKSESKQKLLHDNIDTINSEFEARLRKSFPELTKTEIEVCSLLHLNLSNKDIAEIRNTSEGAVKVCRHRIRNKVGSDIVTPELLDLALKNN